MAESSARRLRSARVMLEFAWRADRRRSVVVFTLCVLQAGATSLTALWLKLLVEAVSEHRGAAAGWVSAALVASVTAYAGLDYAASRANMTLNDLARHQVERRLIELVGGTPTLEIHETPAHLAQLEALRSQAWEFTQVIPSLVRLAETAVSAAITLVLLASVDPLLLVLPLFGLPLLWASPRTGGLYSRGVELAAEPLRRADSLYELTTTAAPAKEIRIFRLREQLLSRFDAAQEESRRIQLDLQIRGAVVHGLARLVFLVGYAGAIVWVVRQAVPGRATVGDVLLTAVLAGQMLAHVGGAGELTQWVNRTLTAAGRFVYLDDLSRRADSRRRAADPPDALSDGIDLRDVTFRYPGGAADTLRRITTHLPAGSTVALVGDNGAGKSTVVKLLSGLCRPTAGAITVDGVDLADLDPGRWRARVSAAFQDHARFEFTLREAVGIGDVAVLEAGERPPSVDGAVRAAFARAGAADVADAAPRGLDTQLGPNWPEGVDLSGGQWQKVAIARAMMRAQPLLLLLDEPTAALDAETEHRLFAQWTAAAAGLREAVGAITLLISHRFSTVRMADLILVLDDGAVVESGRHEELMARGGLYAELFGIQARAYRP